MKTLMKILIISIAFAATAQSVLSYANEAGEPTSSDDTQELIKLLEKSEVENTDIKFDAGYKDELTDKMKKYIENLQGGGFRIKAPPKKGGSPPIGKDIGV